MFASRPLYSARLKNLSLTARLFQRSIHWEPIVKGSRGTPRRKVPIQQESEYQAGFESLFPGKNQITLPSGEYNAQVIATIMAARAKHLPPKRRRLDRSNPAFNEGTPDEVLTIESVDFLEKAKAQLEERKTYKHPEAQTELELEIVEFSSTGDGLAYSPDKNHIYIVPFSVPGDKVLAKTYPQKPHPLYTHVDFIKVLEPSPKREGVTPGCKYFTTCSGCQLQMIPYEDQLRHKKTIVEKAFKNFSNLDPSVVPPVGDTIGSPLQYGYRTKLTPHYDRPRHTDAERHGGKPPPVGFSKKNVRVVIDIEQCPIGTPILNKGLEIERAKVAETFHTRKSGATILLRESTQRRSVSPSSTPAPAPTPAQEEQQPTDSTESAVPSVAEANGNASDEIAVPLPTPLSIQHRSSSPTKPQIMYTYPNYKDIKTYTSDSKSFTTEYIADWTFVSRANSFFQNNNSILPTFIKYVRDNCLPKNTQGPPIKYLLDAYCGSGLFAIGLSPLFSSVLGIDIDAAGVEAARENAKLNGIPNAGFIAADADVLFKDVPFPSDQSLVVIDPPRKGASIDFLEQLCEFGPKRVVYVSCNVHTQARDVGMLVSGLGKKWRYEIESLRGFDFFPQTGHVEGVCFLDRVESKTGNGS
ncbi:tRNA(m5U54)methyltransferase [Exophiala sideris]|uniref:tRNA(M5U54)methyltransferase n=1 Tax=Exophiala sideris TaxID=1016849 RepID=A0ABR0JHU0_9EURO|nr:tRNA(m5U54)methyltransferase [Exophiala sideris]KAK5042448.1 tRNA(m5U54)methyltransferase [Exophiala sideris]KAK5065530.1 tRNA(m5U54)methyltransferase [Exophiala sideris]KAK5186011.1 tRNA(m5U54)methyltransferase [Eurotiomycetes sp. CCFEE 6388]